SNAIVRVYEVNIASPEISSLTESSESLIRSSQIPEECSVTRGKDGTASGRYYIPERCFTNYGWATPVPAFDGYLWTSTNYDYMSPIYKNYWTWEHGGVDLVGTENQSYTNQTDVFAIEEIEEGDVIYIAGTDECMDRHIVIQHISENGPFLAIYGHVTAKDGLGRTKVSKGEQIGKVCPDDMDPPHLHLELRTQNIDIGKFGSVRRSENIIITPDPMKYLITNPATRVVAESRTDSNGLYEMPVPVPPAGKWYLVVISVLDYILTNYFGIIIEPNITTYLETVFQIPTTYSGPGNVSGKIVNALDGTGVSGLTINLREGINVTTGSIVATTTTGGAGYYSFTNHNAGNYTAEVSGSGYNTTYFTVICIGGTTTANQDATITPILASGETRIILTWGETPSDLDSHLTGPLPDGTRFHMYWKYSEYSESCYYGYNPRAESPWPEYVKLDLDDMCSYGPETTTIYQQINGVYRFSVHDFTNRDSSSSTALSNSGAQVRVYRGSNLVATFNVPANQEGTLWTVFEISGDTITPINTMSYESSSVNVQSVSLRRSIETDAPLIRNLPLKR
ncbi:MAG: carboxypeptidase regulatory-like domain-containing protein, partial [Nitrospirota bacterium]